MAEPVITRGLMKVIVHASHRNGICLKCNARMEVKDVIIKSSREVDGKIITTDKSAKRPVCPECGGMIGQLIARPASIQPPDPPQCISVKCLLKFVLDSLFVAYLSSYHRRRVAYAEANRPEKGKKILERYRTGEHAPTTLWGAVIANIKLTCPICRRVETKW